MPRTPADPDNAPPDGHEAIRAKLDELLRRSLLGLGKMAEMEEKIRAIKKRIVARTPPPREPPEGS